MVTPSDTSDLLALMEQVRALRDQADGEEGAAIREALRRSDWFEQRAAKLLGMGRSTLNRLLRPGGRHAAIGEEATQERTRAGYGRGKPPTKIVP